MTAEAMQTSYTKETYLEGMNTIAEAVGRGFVVVGFNTVMNAETGEPTWYVLLTKSGKPSSKINWDLPSNQHIGDYGPTLTPYSPPINAVGKPIE